MPSSDTEASVPTPARRAWWARTLRAVFYAAAITLVTLAILSQTGLMRAFVLARLRSTVGCDAACSGARLALGGTIVVRNLVLRVPGAAGREGVFLEAPRMNIALSWLGVLRGGHGAVESVSLLDPTVRLSIGPDRRLNVWPLAGHGGVRPAGRVPNVTVVNGTLELGEHGSSGAGSYHMLDTITLGGSLTQKRPGSSVYVLAMSEKKGGGAATADGAAPAKDGMRAVGEIDLDHLSGRVTLTDVNLDEWGRKTAPTPVRDLWRTLAISGAIREAQMSYDEKAGPGAQFTLDGVTMNIPVPERVEDEGGTTPAGLLAMRGVSGVIRFEAGGLSADLSGSIEDLPCQVVLSMGTLDLASSALDCRIIANRFKLVERPDLMPLAPTLVRRLMRYFSSPTAEVTSARVQAVRDPPSPDGPAALRVSGLIEFDKGRAEFERFTYPMTDMAGTIRFDDKEVEIMRITGRGPTSARLFAKGRVWPLTDDAAVEVTVTVVDIPMDELFERSLPEARRDIFTAIFDREAYARLRDAGLTTPPPAGPASPGAAGGTAPAEFTLGGLAEMSIKVTRAEGPEHDYLTEITLRSKALGVLPRRFPYASVGHDVVVHITDDFAEFDVPSLSGLTGAAGSVKGRVGYTASDYEPEIEVIARAVPIDDWLLFALPGTMPASGAPFEAGPSPTRDEPGALAPGVLVRRLRLRGEAEAEARIRPLDGGGIGYTIDARARGLSAEPGAIVRADGSREAGFPISNLGGTMRLTESSLLLDGVRGTVGGGAAGTTGTVDVEVASIAASPRGPGAAGDGDRAASPAASLRARLFFDDLDVALPIEKLVAAVAPAQGPRLEALRREYRPGGTIDAAVTLASDEAGAIDYLVRLDHLRAPSFDLLGGRVTASGVEGRAEVSSRLASIRGVRADLAFDGAPAGALAVDGGVALRGDLESVLRAEVSGARFESPMIRAFVSRFDEPAAGVMREHDARGAFDAGAMLLRAPGRADSLETWVAPKDLALTRRGEALRFDSIAGRVVIGPEEGRIEDLRARAASWGFALEGAFRRGVAPSADLSLTVDGAAMTPDFRAALPPEADEALKAVGWTLGGGFALRDGRLRLGPARGAFDFTGEASFADAAMDPGAPIREFTGGATIHAWSEGAPGAGEPLAAPGALAAQADVALRFDRCDVLGLRLTDGRARLRTDPATGAFVLPLVTAASNGGQVAARGIIGPPGAPRAAGPGSTRPGRRYEFQIDFAGVGFGPMLADLSEAPGGGTGGGEPPAGTDDRGTLDASLTLAGVSGDPASRRGRGTLRVSGGEVVRLPWIMPLLQLSNLQPPLGEPLGFASAEFYIDGDRASFPIIELTSDSLAILGEGDVRLSDSALDLRFRTRAGRRVPFLTELLESVRDEFVTTRVTGTLREPVFGTEGLTTTRRMIDSVFQGTPRRTD